MGDSLTYKIIKNHLVSGEMRPGSEIALRIDQTLTQDATGTMAYLQWEAMGLPRVRTELSVSYVDHNMLQGDFRNADDHRYLQTVAARYGIHFSRPGNGICHQVHLERFAVPGKTLLGADSHTPTAGGLGMLAIGSGGLDVAVAMAGAPFYVPMPRVVQVRLAGELPAWVSAKDVILELLRRLSVKGGVGKVFEYTGPGVASLSVPQRATITNMGAELGATSSIFPSDEVARQYMAAQGREKDWRPLAADADAVYDEVIDLCLSDLEPLVARPHSPDRVVPVREVAGQSIDQVCIGSCTNSSVVDLEVVAAILKDRTVHPNVSLAISPGSKQALTMIGESGALTTLVAAGARMLESACGPCLGIGQAPSSGAVSLRSFNRNFLGRSGTADAQVFLTSAEVCAASALFGKIVDPRELGEPPRVTVPVRFKVNDNMIIPPTEDGETVEVVRGPNIQPLPTRGPLHDPLEGELLLVMGDNITTDHIMPAGADVLPFRSNVPALSNYAFTRVNPTFPERARVAGGGIVMGGENYGQGSSREHAALVPMYLGLQAVLAKSFARIHQANLINVGILPLVFVDPADYDRFAQGDRLRIAGLAEALRRGEPVAVENVTQGFTVQARYDLSDRQVEIMLAGGLLNYIKARAEAE
ncbi:MAG TPA: aconitate hydratase [Chloroflexi bacterium]|jgi:aconitate hydratase|nr:aconitate hydratase [Chloroflexota bacterium]